MRSKQIVCLLLLMLLALPGVAGDFSATFNYRLTCPYSAFVIANVNTVTHSSIKVTVTQALFRRPHVRTFNIRISNGQTFHPGEQLLINCWNFPAPHHTDWTSFPNSFYREGLHYHLLARVGADGILHAEGSTDQQGLDMLSWLRTNGRWDVRFETVNGRTIVVFLDGRREQLATDIPASTYAPHQRSGSASLIGANMTYWWGGGLVITVFIVLAVMQLRRKDRSKPPRETD